MKDNTKIVHGGKVNSLKHGVVNTPVYRASTIIFNDTKEMADAGLAAYGRGEKVKFYGRKGTPSSWTLEEAITSLEKGFDTVLTSSGLGAVTTALMSFLKAGDHILVADSVYEPTRVFCDSFLSKFDIKTSYYDPLIGEGILKLVKPNTRIVFMESPGSHTFEVQDLPSISEALNGFEEVVIMIDNTWASPLYHKPLTLGANISIHSCTKYIVGHSDVLMGSITADERHFNTLTAGRQQLGVSASSDDVYLTTRGMRTLAVRMKQHQENAVKVSNWLNSRPEIERVLYPALDSDPGNKIWRRDFSGAGGLIGLIFKKTSLKAVNAMIDNMDLFSLGYSWGGYESLVCPSIPSKARTATRWIGSEPGLRLHIGLEDADDLIDDIARWLENFNKSLNE